MRGTDLVTRKGTIPVVQVPAGGLVIAVNRRNEVVWLVDPNLTHDGVVEVRLGVQQENP